MPEMLGAYVLAKRIGAGGMADVFLARGPNGVCVIKRPHAHLVSDPEFLRMFLDEAALIAQLNHPGIAQIYDLGHVGETYYLAMEYVPGFDLMTISLEHERQGEFIPPELCAKLVSDAAAALHHAHDAVGHNGKPLNLIHRDITPHNILLSTSGQVKLIDFGVARAASAMHKTQTGFVKGKYPYMAPEQVTGSDIDRRVDIYALGLVLYELLTNTRAIQGEYEWEQIENARQGRIRPVEQLRPNAPQPLRDILNKCFAKEPSGRYATAALLQADLDGWLKSERFDLGREDLLRLFRLIAAEAVHSADDIPAPDVPPPQKVPAPHDTLIPFRATEPSLNKSGAESATLPDSHSMETLPPGVIAGGAAQPATASLKPLQLTPAHRIEPAASQIGRTEQHLPAGQIGRTEQHHPATGIGRTEQHVPAPISATDFRSTQPLPKSRVWLFAMLTALGLVGALGALWAMSQPTPGPQQAVAAEAPPEPPQPKPVAALEPVVPTDPVKPAEPKPLPVVDPDQLVPIIITARLEANVVIDGVQWGTTPWKGELKPGVHNVGVTTPDNSFQDSKRVIVEPGKPMRLHFRGIGPKPELATERSVHLNVVPFAKVSIDGKAVSESAFTEKDVKLRDGPHTAHLELDPGGGKPPIREQKKFTVTQDNQVVEFRMPVP